MPYRAGPNTIPLAEHPLVPEDAKPEPCRRLKCLMGLRRPGVQVDADGKIVFTVGHDEVFFVHTHDDQRDTFPIPMAWLDDPNKDIWAEIRPWMESLHEASDG
jgi:hypothetical protein